MADPTKVIKGGLKAIQAASKAADEQMARMLSHSGDTALPLMLPRANPSSDFINQQAERVARQMLGEHVVSGQPKKTANLAGRSAKESQRVKGLDYKLTPTGTVAQEVPYAPRRGDLKVAVPGDQTVSNKILDEVNGFPIDSVQEGGAYYGLGQKHLVEPEFWKSNEEPAKRMQGKVDRVAELYEPDRVIGTHLAMGPRSNNFAMHFADANLRAVDWAKADPNKIDIFDSIIAYGYKDPKTKEMVKFPNWPGLADREGALAAMKEDANLRKWFNDRMKTPKLTKPLGLPNGLDIQYAISEPRLRDMEINMTGLMTGELKPGALVEAAGTPHNTYTHRILGEAGGPQEVLTPFVIDFPDAAQHIASTKKPADFTGTIQKVFPHQLVDDQYLNQYGEYRDRIKALTGQKDGGAINRKESPEDMAQFHKRFALHKATGGKVDIPRLTLRRADGGRIAKGLMGVFNKARNAADAAMAANKVLPTIKRDENLQKFLAPSAEKRRMYHGSKDPNITEFKTRKEMTNEDNMTGHYADERDAVFLSPEPEFTKHFSTWGSTDTHQAPTTYPVYVQVERPFDFDNPEHLKMVKETYSDMYLNPQSEFYDPHLLASERSTAEHVFKKRVDALPQDENNWARIENPAFQDVLKDLGFDSFYTRERGTKNLGVYEPNRIKSATGNRGTYDLGESDITKADGGKIGKGIVGALTKASKMADEKIAADAIGKAAESAGMKAPVTANKPLTTLQDFHTSLGDQVREGAVNMQKLVESMPYKYDKGQRVFTEDSAKRNKPPYTVLHRVPYGNQPMREDHPDLAPGNKIGNTIKDPVTGKTQRTPYEPGYRVRYEDGDKWSQFDIPESAIKGDVEMARGGRVKESPEDIALFHKRFALHKATGGKIDIPRLSLRKPQKFDDGGIASEGAAFGIYPKPKGGEDLRRGGEYAGEFAKALGKIAAESGNKVADDYERLKSSPAAISQLAKIFGANIAGGTGDLVGMGASGLDFVKDALFKKPQYRSVLINEKDSVVKKQEQEPRFGSFADAMKTKEGNQWGGTEDIIHRAQRAGLMYGKPISVTDESGKPAIDPETGSPYELRSGRFSPVTEVGGTILSGVAGTKLLKNAPKLIKKGLDAFTSSKMSPLATGVKTATAGKPTGATYATKQEGPFFRVSPTTLDTSKAKTRGIREGDELQGPAPLGEGAGSTGRETPQLLSSEEVGRIIADPVANEPLNIAKKYTQETQGVDFGVPNIPESSLAKQSAIGRAQQLAIEGSPEYKTAVFDAYAKQMPDVLEQAGAKNYDDLMEKAYRQMAKETDDQFKVLPYNFSYHRAGEGNYNGAMDMASDVHGNKHLYVYQGGDKHDFLNRIDPASGLNENEKFRAVHDLLGHAIYGNQFGPKGEEMAWAVHSQMYSPLARLAMTAETRGQNSMVNYSPLNANLKAELAKYDSMANEARRKGDETLLNKINAAKRQAYAGFEFAPNKAVLLPPEFLDPKFAGGMPAYLQAANRPAKGTETQSVLTHFSNDPNLQSTDPRRYGTGIKGAEGERLRDYAGGVRDRSYFYMGEPGTVAPESGLGVNRYRGEASSLYDITQDPLNFQKLARESNRTPFTAKVNQGVTYPLQDANDIERLVKEYGYQGMANPKATKPMAIMFKETPVRRQARGGLTLMK
jgi:hypothetical protein